MTETQITTTARRIAREINTYAGHNMEMKVYFDAEGRTINAHPADMWYAKRPEWMDEVLVSRRAGRGRVTQRDIQDHLDAIAAYEAEAETSEMSRETFLGWYLLTLEMDRSQH